MKRNDVYLSVWLSLLLMLVFSCEKPQESAKVSTGTIVNIMATSVSITGDITSLGVGISQHGHFLSETPDPGIDDFRTKLGPAKTIGSYTSTFGGLKGGRSYYVCAYIITGSEVFCGGSLEFTTLDTVATLTTAAITQVSSSSAFSGGNITNAGGSSVSARGVCWSATTGPDLEHNEGITTNGEGSGIFTSQINNLDANTTYYVRAYATTEYGTAYGNEFVFLTKGLAEISTSSISSITDISAVCGGTVSDDWGFPVSARGVCWNTLGSPTLKSSEGYTDNGNGNGTFTSNLSGLTGGTTYYVRAYATNSIGVSYGIEKSFYASDPLTDYDGNNYKLVQIGTQIWMAENLKTTHYSNGTAIPLVENAWAKLEHTDKAYCYYDNSTTIGDTFGALYTWAAAMDGAAQSNAIPSTVQGVCPTGWHLPSDAEWKVLEMHLGMSQADADALDYRGTDEGGKLKESGFSHWESPNEGATNSSGFTGLPAGLRAGEFLHFGRYTHFWSSSLFNFNEAWIRRLSFLQSETYRNHYLKQDGISVRCVRD